VKFSTKSNSRAGSHTPRMAVSIDVDGGSSSDETRFHSPKWSHGAENEPTFVSDPFDRTVTPLNQNS
jgi:hypothetical protein